ncbi:MULTISPECIES: 4-carboxy-4-hydroxy-2-oxoadipate aldolase/oxaloacetate decarboxylase [Pseudonocardia]|uniref:Putative 4-hydroxy-4-methyl-2-oxoglutarate aldolase n=2 Tax=Pseudonocardia TaxID=1847 RepID=A0A1Y2MY81_PSEAH|nr:MULTISPECIES: 4-carboxy-4-hydroxy-2-oxoadipate aldolase/oxaloacetate decarboxylase [Pseudonocardia]OSY40174.1 4-hydroxy-4-methyl-2-oxoglutarate aldolase [Pseudonocardia autotrophica]TDN72882.1 4-carboxy-4-hydroxy-2-oxoadipate aldolase [Pseudonocardia autotrophica]BBG03600.1 4-carboxy-4-hydroxy-2-oxoadipate aldolase/oxaloacetate decarboxylase [Pseudonocardia autotrophica]GEC28979.1 4-carboxy-4-hydroxy-2-oxoadipate aldolase/oxaloacetate decarboxylase [Pseudonocardia saturnea]
MSGHVIVRTRRGPDPGVLAELARHGVATVHEAHGRRGLLAPEIRPIQRGARIAGRAVTVLSHPGDNLMIHACIEQCGPGDVLVVATTSRSTDGMFGELFATQLQHRGVLGLISDAGVRDVAELTAMGFPAWSRAVHAQGTAKAVPGSVNVPVVVAGQRIDPGDAVIADDDGVLCVPRAEAATVAEAAGTRAANEEDKRRRFAEGLLGLDHYDLRPTLERLGVRYVDDPEGDRA